MKTAKISVILVVGLVLAVCSAKLAEAAPMGTGFTYQGLLYDVNDAADGLYDFAFKLYDANTGGSQQGSTIDVNDLDVMDGQFTVRLDFGGGVFDGNAIWLETTVAQSDGSDPCTLSPRQEITPTPYALYAVSGPGAQGDIASVIAGSGLTGGGVSSDVTLNVDFAGTGLAITVARSDHDHDGVYALVGHIHSGSDITAGTVNEAYIDPNITRDAELAGGLAGKADVVHNHSADDVTSGTLSADRYTAYGDLSVEGYLGDASGDLAQNNGTVQTDLNADMLDGFHRAAFVTLGDDYGRHGISSTLYEGTTALSDKYLGISAMAVNSDKVDGYDAGNSSGQVAVSNNTVCTSLNADKLDGYDENDFFRLNQDEIVTGRPAFTGGTSGSTPPFSVDSTYVVGGLNADMLDGEHASYFVKGNGLGNYIAKFIGPDTIGNSAIYESAGNVGIGTPGPGQKLDVAGDMTASRYFDRNNTSYYVDPASTSVCSDMLADIFRDRNNTSYYVDPASPGTSAKFAGDVGIGTTSPGAKLEVSGGQIKITGGSPGTGKVLTSDASGLASWQTPAAGGDDLGNHIATQNIELNGHWLSGDGGSEGVFVNSPGNIGIGTTSPQNKLDVEGAIAIGASYSGTETAPSNGMIVQGNVGIGDTSPDYKLDVDGKGYFEDGIKTGDAASGDGVRFGKKYSDASDINPIVSCYSGYVWWDYSEKALKLTETNAGDNACYCHGYRFVAGGPEYYTNYVYSGGTEIIAEFTGNGHHATFEITSERSDAGYIHIHAYYSNSKLIAHYWYMYQ